MLFVCVRMSNYQSLSVARYPSARTQPICYNSIQHQQCLQFSAPLPPPLRYPLYPRPKQQPHHRCAGPLSCFVLHPLRCTSFEGRATHLIIHPRACVCASMRLRLHLLPPTNTTNTTQRACPYRVYIISIRAERLTQVERVPTD